jgi:hypothetical protein
MAMLDPDLAQRIDMNMVLVDGEEEDRLYSGVAVSDSEEDDMHLQSAESSEVQMDRNMSNVRYGASFMRGEPPDYSPPDASEDFEEVADAARRM